MSDEPEDRDASGLPPPPWGREITPLTEVCGGQYVLLHEIARGDLSVVYRAKPAGSRDALAFKVLQPRFVGDETQERRFRREAELLRRIEHPNVVRMVDHGTIEDGRDFVALELLAGRPLAEVLAEAERMSPERTCRIARQIARALRAMHNAGVIHRDLKPSNILLIGPEDAERVKLVDFGEAGDVGAPARRVKGSGRAESDVHEGPTYRPPEQQRKRPPQATMDVFALGVVMFEMLTGQHPFVEAKDKLGQTIRSKAFDAPEVFLGLVSDCIERSPRDRPQSMEEVLERIDKALLWMGVVPHELTTGDEDERTQPYVVADPGYADPAAQARPAAPPPSSRPKSPQDGATVAGEVVLSATDPFDEDLIQTQRRRIHVADEDDADDESDHMPTQRRRVGSDRPQEPAAF
ncbi:MAG: serine/threonine protein kinase, partial [Myxococcales bacterium]|nr:serine/threonine protein kinase [Myxococcales bacterium]